MARVIFKRSELKEKMEQYKRISVISLSVCMVAFFLWMLNIIAIRSFSPLFLFPTFTAFAFGGGIGAFAYNSYKRYRSGYEGEAELAEVIGQLPDTYYGVANVKIYYENKPSELDMVVVGPTGIFIVEAKNHRGKISGDYSAKYLLHEKISSGGNYYQKSLYNPVKQVATHTYRLSHFFKANDVSGWISNAVYFTSPLAYVSVTGDIGETPIFTCSNGGDTALKQYIVDSNKAVMSEGEISKAVQLLVSC